MEHHFRGVWISDAELASLEPRNVFFRQLERVELDCTQHRNRHVLFRAHVSLERTPQTARIFLSADDYYKLYVNGAFVAQGPAPSYHFRQNYNTVDLSGYLHKGENVIAVHTLYQGLVNRVWQSGDRRHGLLCDLEVDGELLLCNDERFLVATHTGYTELGVTGKHRTQFLERYDSRAPEVGFERPDFDDSLWANASVCRHDDHVMRAQESRMLTFETILPKKLQRRDGRVLIDFGANYGGTLRATAHGKSGDCIRIRCAQELDGDGSPRFDLRANCKYEEDWILSDGESHLDWFDYKAFRYAELELPAGVTLDGLSLSARHYPFVLRAAIKPEYESDPALLRIWQLCLHTQKYGVQEVIQDCMDREKGFYLGDGCYTALTHLLLTCDDSMVKKLIDDAFASSVITDTLVTCLDCSFMQEIAEYPLIMVSLILWHYRLTHDRDYLAQNEPKVRALLDAYRRDYERDGLLRELDKWCVVEWPKDFQHGYDVDVREGQVCHEAHVAINAYYLNAVRTANTIARELGHAPYRDDAPLLDAFYSCFYDPLRKLFRDGESTEHTSLVGNSFVYAFGLCPEPACREAILALYDACGIHSLGFFCTFPFLAGLARDGDGERIRQALLDPGAWLRMLNEDATTTFEGWGKETKKNASLFHLTMSFAALFLADADLSALFSDNYSTEDTTK